MVSPLERCPNAFPAVIHGLRGFSMAIGRAHLHRELDHESPFEDWARQLWRWRHWVLLCLALLAAALATVSLVKSPSDEPPPSTSYLPAPPGASP
jgi:hypothetical protein